MAEPSKNNQPKSKGGKRPGAGRPKGVPNKATAAIREIAGQYTEQAVTALVSILAGGEGIPAAAQVAAAKELLDRAHGKPSQALTGEGGGPIELLSRIERVIIEPKGSGKP